MGITASINGNLVISDSITGSVSLQKPISNSYQGTIEAYSQSQIVGTSPTTITLPISPVEFFYLKNLSSTSGTTVTVTWTPTGGSSASVLALDPGGYIFFCEGTTTNGVTAISVVASAAGTPIEYVTNG